MSIDSNINETDKLILLNKQIEEKENYLNRLKYDISSREGVLNSLKEQTPDEIKKLEEEINKRDKQIKILQDKVTELSNSEEVSKLKTYIEDLKKLEIAKDFEINKLHGQLLSREKEIERLKALKPDKQEASSEGAGDNEELKILQTRFTNMEFRVMELSDEKKKLEKEIQSLREENNLLLKEKNTHDPEEVTKLKEQIEILAKEKDELRQTNRTHIHDNENKAEITTININNISLEKIIKEHEEEKAHSAALLKERTELENKIINMKSALQEIKEKFDVELARKEKFLNEKQTNQQNMSENIIKDLTYKLKTQEEQNKKLKGKLEATTKDKLELEDIVIRQEEKVNELAGKVNLIEKLLKEKNKEIKENQNYAIQLVNIIEDQKKQLANSKNYKFPKEEDNELLLLRNQVNNLKKENEMKDKKINTLQVNNRTLQEKLYKTNSNPKIRIIEERKHSTANRPPIQLQQEDKQLSGIPSMNNNEVLPVIEHKVIDQEVDEDREKLEEITRKMKEILDSC